MFKIITAPLGGINNKDISFYSLSGLEIWAQLRWACLAQGLLGSRAVAFIISVETLVPCEG